MEHGESLSPQQMGMPGPKGSDPPKKPHRTLGTVVATRSVWVKDFRQNVTSAASLAGHLGGLAGRHSPSSR